MESGSREPSVREGNEGAATRGAAVEGGRAATAALGWAYIPGDSCPPSVSFLQKREAGLLPIKGSHSDWGEGNPSKGAELLLL